VIAAVQLSDLAAAVEVAGPGFINVTIRDDVLGEWLGRMNRDPRLGVPVTATPRRVVIDYSGPNVAKEMHVGHLRSTIIGDAAARVLEWVGHEVHRVNHVGDWGTPFGMLLEHLLDDAGSPAAAAVSPAMADLTALYQAARARFEGEPGFAERTRRRVVLLQNGDPITVRWWRRLVDQSTWYFQRVYDRLDVTLTPQHVYGESWYQDRLPDLMADLDSKGLVRRSEGALCCFPRGFTGRDGQPMPLIVRKADGGYNYAAADLAALRYRLSELGADQVLYVIGVPQRQHLAMVFQTAREAGWLTDQTVTHVAFGSVLGRDGRMLRTRAGDLITLAGLLDEAVSRAAAAVAEKNPGLDPAAVAAPVGIGAVKYADLSTDRIKDYVFDYDRMLALTGDTSVYLQYANARVNSIFARGAVTPDRTRTPVVAAAAERALALRLLAFPDVVAAVAETLEFHRLTGYLFELAGLFATFFERCPVLRGPDTASRLVLCDLTGRTLTRGLALLGIAAPQRM
jgi:arginyl-tRNA synthetase